MVSVTGLVASKKCDTLEGDIIEAATALPSFQIGILCTGIPVSPLKKISHALSRRAYLMEHPSKHHICSPVFGRCTIFSLQAVIPPEAADVDFSIWDENDPCISM